MDQSNSVRKESWDHFLLEHSGSFLQSFEWGEFQEKFGRKVFRFSGENWLAQFVEYKLPMGKKYWYGPRAPFLETRNSELKNKNLGDFIKKISEAAKKEKVMFFRICPEKPAKKELEAELEIFGFKKLRYDVEPSQTLILDITKSEPELLAQMHPKWRYNIALAQKKGVQVKIVKAGEPEFEKHFEKSFALLENTARRQKIRLHPKEYYKNQLQTSGEQFKALLFLAEYEGKIIAANSVNFFARRATYLHGGSDNEYRQLMAPHLLQWEQICEAKKQGCAQYDFWGIDEQKWAGLTRFKRGFGGREVKYIGTWDYPLDKKWYLIYRGVQRLRR